MMWPVTRRVMMRMYDITPGAASESRLKLEGELDWLDSKLSDGRLYLAGDRFSRADLTTASLLAPFARPQEMPVFHEMMVPDTLATDFERWRDRPVMRWVVTQYQTRRAPMRGGTERQRDHQEAATTKVGPNRKRPVAPRVRSSTILPLYCLEE
jgi:glutathione S-transferase